MDFDTLSKDLDSLTNDLIANCRTQLNLPNSKRDRMLDTFTQKLPQGTEKGEYIVVDFGGRFFR